MSREKVQDESKAWVREEVTGYSSRKVSWEFGSILALLICRCKISWVSDDNDFKLKSRIQG